jgi:hypothetical protein
MDEPCLKNELNVIISQYCAQKLHVSVTEVK